MLTSGTCPAEAPIRAGSIPAAASPSAIASRAWVASSAPSTLTPIAPPRLRKNAISELPAPMSAAGTVFCTTSTRFCISMPRPAPTTSMNALSSIRLVVSSSVPISASPSVSSVAPSSIQRL